MNVFLWILQILLAAFFAFSGTAKFLIPADEITKNMPAFLSLGFIYFIGVCEILGAVGLVVPWLTRIRPGLTPLAAFLLAVIMIGATAITVVGSPAQALIPLVTGVLLLIVARGRKAGA